MKYTRQCKDKNGKNIYRFTAPRDAKKAGVVKDTVFRDGRTARFEIPKLIERVEAFRRGEIAGDNISEDSPLRRVVAHYLNSKQHLALSNNSQKMYERTLAKVCSSKVLHRELGDYRLKDLTVRKLNEFYEKWIEEVSVYNANANCRILSVVLNYAMSLDILPSNPVARIKKVSHKPVSYVWTREQVEAFVDEAFKDFDTRSLGLIALMCYEWAQRPIDIINLKWDDVDLDKARVKIKQSKRGATVELPIDDELLEMLKQQKEDWDFQPYVAPYYRKADRAYLAYPRDRFNEHAQKIREKVGIPKELKLGHLRKTAIGEMVDAQIDSVSIMQVTGHKSVSSLNPYIRHTYEGAKSAMNARNKYKEDNKE